MAPRSSTLDGFHRRKVLVTGGLGFIGSNLVRSLVKSGAEVTVVDSLIPEYGGNRRNLAGVRTGLRINISDVRDRHSLPYFVRGQDFLFNLAGQTSHMDSMTDPETDLEINARAQLSILEACRQHNPGIRVVFASTRQLYGRPDYLPVDAAHPRRPTDPYALSKKLCEDMARSFADRGKMEVTVLRPVYVLYPEFEAEVKARAADPTGYKGPAAGGRQPAGGGPMWHYVDPRDVATAYRCALEVEDPGFGPYFVCGPTTLAPEPTVERLRVRTGRETDLRDLALYRVEPHAPLYDLSAAADRIGFRAAHDLRRVLYG